jgi:hypothetical protein
MQIDLSQPIDLQTPLDTASLVQTNILQSTQEALNALFVSLPSAHSIPFDSNKIDASTRTRLILAGFTISPTELMKPASNAAVPLRKLARKPVVVEKKKVWTLEDDDDDDLLIDDDALLDEEDIAKPAEACVPDAKKKACKVHRSQI